ncbi:MAG: EscU/YscU/HrcU family type III secretion system export apparatus switch protein [Deltaproteobacteria bacterium]|nr:EscU/YscU/HrcU family type III secretion system export apparatus switch protein [Deltaproteobacteria bacterium]
MSDGGTGEKTEEPTPERLRKLRQEGNVPKSQDVTMAMSFLCLFVLLSALFGYMGEQIRDLIYLSHQTAFSRNGMYAAIPRMLYSGLKTLFFMTAPILVAAVVLGVSMNVAQVGFMFTTKPLHPNLNKINPINGFKNLFNMKKVVELIKTLVKFTIIVYLSWVALRDALRDIAYLVRGTVPVGIMVIGSIIWSFTIKIAGAFLLIAAVDYIYQRKRYTKDNMMSKYDIKQEYKQSEGDPQQKSERKRIHQEILNSQGTAAVKNADVVVRNPEHIAVALKYDKEKGSAPQVVAKGSRIWAEKILETARHYGVPVVRNVPLAHALDKLEVGDEIPEELYEAVAEILNFVFSLAQEQKKKQKKNQTNKLPATNKRSPTKGR